MRAPQMRTPGGNLANADQTTADAAIVGQSDRQRKGLATIQAEAALKGVEVLRLQDGRVVASREGDWFKVLRNGRDLARYLGPEWLL